MKRKTAQLAAVKEKKGSAALMDEEGVGSGMDCAGTGCRGGSRVASRQYGVGLSQDERHGVVMEEIKEHAKPNGQFGEGTARMFQHILQAGNSLNQVGPMVQTWILHRTGVSMKNELKISFARKTAEVLSLGITKLDSDELKEAIMRAPCLCVAADESLWNGDKKYPIFVSFWDAAAETVWWGLVRGVCVMKDKTAETQAQLFYETIVDVLKYPRKRVLYVLSDNMASVSGEVGGCISLLQRKLKGEDTKKKRTKPEQVEEGEQRVVGGAQQHRGGEAEQCVEGGAELYATGVTERCVAGGEGRYVGDEPRAAGVREGHGSRRARLKVGFE